MPRDERYLDRPLGRRRFLCLAGAVGLGSLIARSTHAGPSTPLGPVWQAGTCTLTPLGVVGPYYLPLDLLRQDITEGRPGFALELYLKVVRVSTCLPLAGAIVDVWHASALGRYSGFAAQGTAGQSFLRGIQVTPTNGVVQFHTVFPGWYPGRATHIHVKVRPTPASQVSTQLYFPASIERILAAQPVYAARGPNPLANTADPLFTPETLVPLRALAHGALLPPFTGGRRLLAGFTIAVA